MRSGTRKEQRIDIVFFSFHIKSAELSSYAVLRRTPMATTLIRLKTGDRPSDVLDLNKNKERRK